MSGGSAVVVAACWVYWCTVGRGRGLDRLGGSSRILRRTRTSHDCINRLVGATRHSPRAMTLKHRCSPSKHGHPASTPSLHHPSLTSPHLHSPKRAAVLAGLSYSAFAASVLFQCAGSSQSRVKGKEPVTATSAELAERRPRESSSPDWLVLPPPTTVLCD